MIYGSWARRYAGEPGAPPNDIDVLVIGTPDVPAVRDVAANVSHRVGRDVNVTFLTAKEWSDGTSGFIHEVRGSPLVELDLTA